MAAWTQTYTDEAALADARARVRRLAVVFGLASAALVVGAPLAAVLGGVDAGAVAAVCGALLTVSAAAVIASMASENRRVWRVEVSVRHVVGTDARGHATALPWSRVDGVDVSSAGLLVTGHGDDGRQRQVAVPASMPGFVALAHRAVEYAEARGRVVSVEGCPVGALDLVALYPTLCASRPAPPTSAPRLN